MAIVLLFTALLLSSCLGMCAYSCVDDVWKGMWCVAIVLLFTALLLSGCLGGVPCCCDARGGGGSVLWRLCYYLQHFCSPAAMVCVAVLLCCWGGREMVRGDCATIYSTSAVRLPWCAALLCC